MPSPALVGKQVERDREALAGACGEQCEESLQVRVGGREGGREEGREGLCG